MQRPHAHILSRLPRVATRAALTVALLFSLACTTNAPAPITEKSVPVAPLLAQRMAGDDAAPGTWPSDTEEPSCKRLAELIAAHKRAESDGPVVPEPAAPSRMESLSAARLPLMARCVFRLAREEAAALSAKEGHRLSGQWRFAEEAGTLDDEMWLTREAPAGIGAPHRAWTWRLRLTTRSEAPQGGIWSAKSTPFPALGLRMEAGLYAPGHSENTMEEPALDAFHRAVRVWFLGYYDEGRCLGPTTTPEESEWATRLPEPRAGALAWLKRLPCTEDCRASMRTLGPKLEALLLAPEPAEAPLKALLDDPALKRVAAGLFRLALLRQTASDGGTFGPLCPRWRVSLDRLLPLLHSALGEAAYLDLLWDLVGDDAAPTYLTPFMSGFALASPAALLGFAEVRLRPPLDARARRLLPLWTSRNAQIAELLRTRYTKLAARAEDRRVLLDALGTSTRRTELDFLYRRLKEGVGSPGALGALMRHVAFAAEPIVAPARFSADLAGVFKRLDTPTQLAFTSFMEREIEAAKPEARASLAAFLLSLLDTTRDAGTFLAAYRLKPGNDPRRYAQPLSPEPVIRYLSPGLSFAERKSALAAIRDRLPIVDDADAWSLYMIALRSPSDAQALMGDVLEVLAARGDEAVIALSRRMEKLATPPAIAYLATRALKAAKPQVAR